MKRLIAMIASLLLAVGLSNCGDDSSDAHGPFNLASTRSENLIKGGMEKEMFGELDSLPSTGERVMSADSTKLLWCDGLKVMIEDADGASSTTLFEETEDSSVVSCFDPEWSSDGTEVAFSEAVRHPGDSAYQIMRVIITLDESREN